MLQVWQKQMGNTLARVRVRMKKQAQEQVQAQAQAAAQAQARVRTWLRVSTQEEEVARAQVQARVNALAQAQARAQALVEALVGEGFVGRVTFTYGEVLADSEIMDIIYSIENRHHLAREAWHLAKHWWLIQIIAPITRLPQELLQQILLIIIDEGNDSHFDLMLVSKHWYNIVTGIWVSLQLGTTMPRDAVTRKLEEGLWTLPRLAFIFFSYLLLFSPFSPFSPFTPRHVGTLHC